MTNERLIYTAATLLCAAGLLAPNSHAQRRRDFNLDFRGDADRCSDLKVTSRDGELAQATESFTLSKSEAPTLEMTGIDRGMFRVRGWDQPNYSVEACKLAAAETRAAADAIVRGISVTRAGGRLSVNGPAGSDQNWQVYFIVHAPKDANLNLETRNGPIDIAGVSGTLKVRAKNGPVALRDSSGVIDVNTTNGPISFSGGSGEVHLIAQNGPISLDLAGETWNGPRLEARTVNGPVSLGVDEKFRSGVRVETSGHAPISCSLGTCRSAWRDDRVMQLNGSQDTISVSTTNGPVSVHGPRTRGRII